MAGPLTYQRVSVDALGWTALVAPEPADHVVIENLGPATVRLATTPDDPSAEKAVLSGVQEVLAGPARRPRFAAGQRVCYARAQSGTATLMLSWLQ